MQKLKSVLAPCAKRAKTLKNANEKPVALKIADRFFVGEYSLSDKAKEKTARIFAFYYLV